MSSYDLGDAFGAIGSGLLTAGSGGNVWESLGVAGMTYGGLFDDGDEEYEDAPPWYSSPLVLGGGVVALLALVLITKKK